MGIDEENDGMNGRCNLTVLVAGLRGGFDSLNWTITAQNRFSVHERLLHPNFSTECLLDLN